jgi:hypothetical protein
MKAALKKLFIRLKTARFVGKPVRFAIAVYRIPRSRAQLISVLETLPRLEFAYREQVPALLESISKLNDHHFETREQENLVLSVPAALRALRKDITADRESIDYLLKRVEFVRRELMFEMRYGSKRTNPDRDAMEVQPKVIAVSKLAAARSGKLRLNLGCGHVPLDGYLNIDRRELPGVDIVAEAGQLPFEAGEVDEISSAHLLEHFPQEQLKRELLPYWKSLLKPGGLFRAIVPDAEAMIREYSNGRYPYYYMRQVFYGAQDYDGDFHHNMFIPSHLSALLTEAGFVDDRVIEAGRRNDICYEFEIAARSPN